MWAADNLKGRPWFDWVRYRRSDGTEQYGRVRVLVASLAGSMCRKVVVERAKVATPRPNCPFAAYGCTRLRWALQPGSAAVELEAIDLGVITKVLCVEHDWEDWLSRHSLDDFPSTHPIDADDLEQRRFIINALVQ